MVLVDILEKEVCEVILTSEVKYCDGSLKPQQFLYKIPLSYHNTKRLVALFCWGFFWGGGVSSVDAISIQ